MSAFTMCLKQDISNAGLAIVSIRPVETAVCWSSVCSGDGRVTHTHMHTALCSERTWGSPAILSGIYCTCPCWPPQAQSEGRAMPGVNNGAGSGLVHAALPCFWGANAVTATKASYTLCLGVCCGNGVVGEEAHIYMCPSTPGEEHIMGPGQGHTPMCRQAALPAGKSGSSSGVWV